MWIEMRNPVGASILLITNAICMTAYAYFYHNEECTNPSKEKVTRMILSGLFYFFAWMSYMETFKYKKFSVAYTIQTMIMFSCGGLFTMTMLDNKYNKTKLFSFVVGLIAISLFAYSETLPNYPIFDKKMIWF
jgi:glucose uptake protein GlcU